MREIGSQTLILTDSLTERGTKVNDPEKSGAETTSNGLGSETKNNPTWPPSTYAEFRALLHPDHETPGAADFCPACGLRAVELDRIFGGWLVWMACPDCDAEEIDTFRSGGSK